MLFVFIFVVGAAAPACPACAGGAFVMSASIVWLSTAGVSRKTTLGCPKPKKWWSNVRGAPLLMNVRTSGEWTVSQLSGFVNRRIVTDRSMSPSGSSGSVRRRLAGGSVGAITAAYECAIFVSSQKLLDHAGNMSVPVARCVKRADYHALSLVLDAQRGRRHTDQGVLGRGLLRRVRGQLGAGRSRSAPRPPPP